MGYISQATTQSGVALFCHHCDGVARQPCSQSVFIYDYKVSKENHSVKNVEDKSLLEYASYT